MIKSFFKSLTINDVKSFLYKLIIPSKGKVVIGFGLGLIGVSFSEALTNAIFNYIGIPMQYTNSPYFGLALVVIGLLYEGYIYYIDNVLKNKKLQTKINASVKRLKKDFFDGNFTEAIDFLNSLLAEYEDDVEIKYQLLVVKISFLMQLRKMDEFKEYIELIENDYTKFINIEFRELKLTLLAFENNQDFFDMSKKLRLETPNSKPQGHFDIIYHLNGGDLNIAKDIFEEEIKHSEYRDKLLLIGGHIYSNLYKYGTDDENNFVKADEYYKEALEKEELSFLDKMLIQGFYAHRLMNDQIRQKKATNEEFLKYLKEYKKSLEIILVCKKYFNHQYIHNLFETYTHILLSLNLKDDYLSFYESNSDAFSMRQYIQYCDIKGIDYSHEKIQNYIKSNFLLDDLLLYTSLISNNNIEEIKIIIDFLEENTDYKYKHHFAMYCFVKGCILLNLKISDDVLAYLEKDKYTKIDCLLAFLEYQYYLGSTIDDVEIEKLLEFSNDCTIVARIVDVIKLLQQLGKREQYLSLALIKQDTFYSVVFETLKICEEDKDLLFSSFDNFINKIVDKEIYSAVIGRIYLKYDKLDVVFNNYYLEFKRNKTLWIMFELLNMGLAFYNKSGEVFDNKKQLEVLNDIIADIDKLEIQNLIFLLNYVIIIQGDTKQVLPYLNQRLLELDINEINGDIKIDLSNMYLNTQFDLQNYAAIFNYEDNFCLVNDGKTFIRNNYSILEINQNNFGFITVDDNEYFIMKQDDSYKEQSLFHRIIGPFAYRCDNPSMQEFHFDENAEEPMAEVFEMIKQQSLHTKNLFQRYSDGELIGLYTLAKGKYNNYFSLIPYLLENKNINFYSGDINFHPKANKILALSSIVFLSHIGQLDKVFKREDIFIQRTLINWLKEYSTKIDFISMPTELSYLDEIESPTLHRNTNEEVNKLKSLVLKLVQDIIQNCKIIEDQLEVMPIKGANEMLANQIGKQEYQALAYCLNHKFQIITEDRIFNMLFGTMKLNMPMASNSLLLLEDILSYEELRGLRIELHLKRYKNILDKNYMHNLIVFMQKHDLHNLEDEEKELIKIVDGYGWINKTKEIAPISTNFDGNYKKLLNIIDSSDSALYKQLDLIDDGKMQ